MIGRLYHQVHLLHTGCTLLVTIGACYTGSFAARDTKCKWSALKSQVHSLLLFALIKPTFSPDVTNALVTSQPHALHAPLPHILQYSAHSVPPPLRKPLCRSLRASLFAQSR